MMTCDNCGREFADAGALKRVFPDIPDLLGRIEPGGIVPAGECPECGALVYAETASLVCTICGDIVDIDDIRAHLGEHNPNALNLDWEQVRGMFRLGPAEESANTVPVCPSCGAEGRIAQLDIVPGCALIESISADGSIEWAGDTELDWNNQRPASNPREFICLACRQRFGAASLGIK